MRAFFRIFGRGLMALLPTFLSVYILIRFFHWVDETIHFLLSGFLPEGFYIPGMGLFFGVLFIFFLGLSLSHYLGNRIHRWLDHIFRQVPLVKSIYTAIRDLTDYFSPEGEESTRSKQVVVVKWPGTGVQAIGLVTRSDLSGLPEGVDKDDKVAVFFPMSYQMGGFTIFLPKTFLTPLDMKVEVVMRSALTGWMKKPHRN